MTTVPEPVKSIPTRYAGCHFRSRLEARWAVFFDALDIPWEYEPAGFELAPFDDADTWGGRTQGWDEHLGFYLPDFFLPSLDAWFEVKGAKATSLELLKAWRLNQITGKQVFVAWGQIPHNTDYNGFGRGSVPGYCGPNRNIETQGDYDYAWCVCPTCGKYGIEFDGRGERICRHGQYDKGYTADNDEIQKAYTAARSARFEHGQSGAS